MSRSHLSRTPVRRPARPPRVAGSRPSGRPVDHQSPVTDDGAAGDDGLLPDRPDPAEAADRTDVPRRRPTPRTHRPRRARGWWPVAGLAVLVVALAVAGTVLMLGWQRAEARTDARAAVPSLAKTYAAKILSYDYRHIRADADAVTEVTTGDYRRQYRKSMDQLIIPQAKKVHAVVRAEVISAGVTRVSRDAGQVVVLVYANQTVTNTKIQGSRVDQVRVRLTLDRTDQGWRVSKIDSV